MCQYFNEDELDECCNDENFCAVCMCNRYDVNVKNHVCEECSKVAEENPNQLPIIKHKGKEYFVDLRLKEFRPVEPPLESILFDSELGIEIDEMPEPEMDSKPERNIVIVTCLKCQKVLFVGPMKETKRLIIYCTDCFK